MPLVQNWIICFKVTLNAILKTHKMQNKFVNLQKDSLLKGAQICCTEALN